MSAERQRATGGSPCFKARAAVAVACLVLAVAAPTASAQQTLQAQAEARASILPGPLVITQCSDVTVDSRVTRGYHNFTLTCLVIDATGTGNGWQVSMMASTGIEAGQHGAGNRRTPPAQSVANVVGVGQELVAGEPAQPSGVISYPVPLFDEEPAAIFDSAPLSGMGRMLFTINGRIRRQQMVRFGVPSLTFSIVTGP